MELTGLKIAHRGIFDNKLVPENSLLAFSKAKEMNIPIELDIQITKDGALVVFHDDNLKRMCGINRQISEITLKELKQIHLLSTNETIPTLQEVFDLIQGIVLLDIELKETDNYKLLCELVLKQLNNYQGEVLLKSFQPNIVRYLKKKKTDIPIGLLMMTYHLPKFYSYFVGSKLFIWYCNPDFLAIDKRIIQKKKFQRYRLSKPCFVWTIVDSEELNYYSNYADNFLCNYLPYEK